MPQYQFKWPPIAQIAVVLCIIAFMAFVLYPLYHPSHEPLRRISCQSNLKQIGLAYIQYEQDADGSFPPGVNTNGNGWAGQLYGFTKSTGLYQCADDATSRPSISYAENQNLVRLPVKAFAVPAATVALYEFSTLSCDPSTPEAVSATGLSAPQDSTRHDTNTFGLNFLTVDGHVRWLLPAQISGGVSAVSPKSLPSGGFVQTFAVK